MNRPWHVLLLYLVCLTLVLAAMAWLTIGSLRLDCAEALAREELQQEIDIKLAVLRMDSVLTPLLAQEAARPFDEFSSVPRLESAPQDSTAQQAASAFLERESPPHVFLNFQCADGQWSSAQVTDRQIPEAANSPADEVPAAQELDPAEAPRSTEVTVPQTFGQVSDQTALADKLRELSQSVNVDRLLASLPVETLGSRSELSGRRNYRLDQVVRQEVTNSYRGSFTGEMSNDSRASRQQTESLSSFGQDTETPRQTGVVPRKKGWGANQDQLKQEQQAAKGQRELATRNQVVQAYAADTQRRSRGGAMGRNMVIPRGVRASSVAGATTVIEGVSRALWVGDKLLLARRTRIGNRELIQGSWLDWHGIKRLLLDQIADLVPQADLIPVTEETPVAQFRPGRALAALPVQLVVPEPVLAVMPWTPVRVSLVAVWICLTLAAAAIGLLLWGVLQLSERRTAFVAAVTHELRTPLTTFRMYSEMLADDMVTDPSQRHDYLQTLRAESERLAHLVENVLSYARLERGRHVGTRTTTTAGEISDRCQRRLAARADEAGMELVVEGDAAARRAVLRTDVAAVEQVLFNLVDNASKYAAGGSDRRVHLELKSHAGGVMFSVADHGPGISPQAARDLFQPFSKSVEDAAQTAPGVGLGLALSHRLARDLRGRLQMKSSPEGGAVFELRLPRGS